MVPLPYHVVDRQLETADVVTLDLEADGDAIADPLPGQFTMLYAFGIGEAPISVSGTPGGDGVLRHTIRMAGAVTAALCELAPGDSVGVRGPFGTGWPVDAAVGRDVIIVGGGIGFAPLRPVIRHVATHRDDYERVSVVAGARTPGDLLYQDELAAWRARFDLDVEVTVDAATREWRGDVGVVTKALPRIAFDAARTVAMLCGPEVMMRAVARSLLDAGMTDADIHVSLERNMHCAIQQCGHCQLGPLFVCSHGPVVPWSVAGPVLEVRRW